MEDFPRMVTAVIPGQAKRFYLVDQELDFIPEVKELVDQKVSNRRAPGTIRGLCIHLRWYYRFLKQRQLQVLTVKAPDLADFLLWLSNPYRAGDPQPQPLQPTTINQILGTVASLYNFLVRRGHLTESPMLYKTVPRRWGAAADGDLLAHTRRRSGHSVQRLELRLKELQSHAKTVSPANFEAFIEAIQVGKSPNTYPSRFRDRVMVIVLRESGLRCGELLGIRIEDLDFRDQGIHVRFRTDNENGSRAKAGYGRDRFVPLPPEVLGLLDIYLTEVWVNANVHSDYLWLVLKRTAVNGDGQNTFGTALNQTAVNQMFLHYSQRSEIKIHPHMLRHTHATDLVRSYTSRGKPVDWKFIADRLGHSSVVTTMQTYAHLTKEDQKESYELYRQKKEEADVKRRQSHRTRATVEQNATDVARPAARPSKPAAQQT